MEQRAAKPWYEPRKADLAFVVGLAGAVHEIFFSSLDRPSLLIFIAGLLGYPIWVRADEARRTSGRGNDPS